MEKGRGGKSQRREEKKKEDQRRERVRGKKMQVREQVEKSRFTAIFQWFVAPEGRKVSSLKRRVRCHLARWEMKNCTPLWREARFEVKMYKTHYITQHYTILIALHYTRLQLHYTTILIALHYTRLQLHYTTLHYTTVHKTTAHYTTLHYTTLTTPHHNYNSNYNYSTLITSHYNYSSTTLHYEYNYNYNYNCTTPNYIQQLWVRWPLQPLQPLQKTQLQPPFGPSVDSPCHSWFTTTHLSYSVLSLKLPPPPCAVLVKL